MRHRQSKEKNRLCSEKNLEIPTFKCTALNHGYPKHIQQFGYPYLMQSYIIVL